MFGEPFDDGAVIGEERVAAEEFLAGIEPGDGGVPELEDGPRLDPAGAADAGAWLRKQARLWLGEAAPDGEGDAWALALGDALRAHPVFRALLAEAGGSHLPLVVCNDCGALGWATKIDRDRRHVLRTDLSGLYRGFFGGDPRVAFLYPGAAVKEGDPTWRGSERLKVAPADLTAYSHEEAPPQATVEVVKSNNTRTVDGRARLHRDCPFCGARESLAIVGFRAATLTGVFVDQLFASPWSDDDRLLCFSDSVQDAAHRAGFLGARTWRTNLRIALRQALGDAGEPVPLADVADRAVEHWRGAARMDEAAWISTFLAPNMEWLHGWDALRKTGKLPEKSDLAELIALRLRWEVVTELGMQARVGRSLPRTGAATAGLDAGRLDACLAELLPVVQNEVPGLAGLEAGALRRFLLGLLHDLRLRGGIHDEAVPEGYLASGGDDAHVFARTHHLPGFGRKSRLPAFLTDRTSGVRFDSWLKGRGTRCRWRPGRPRSGRPCPA